MLVDEDEETSDAEMNVHSAAQGLLPPLFMRSVLRDLAPAFHWAEHVLRALLHGVPELQLNVSLLRRAPLS